VSDNCLKKHNGEFKGTGSEKLLLAEELFKLFRKNERNLGQL
jgi:hypothetical protein